MIVSASRRTDIPAYYADWFCRRLREGFAYVRNPFRPSLIYRVPLTPDVVDGLVLWTKNPRPILGRLEALRDYVYYFQFTLTPYGRDVEPNIPPKEETAVPAFQELARRVGKERVVWRYDPILISPAFTFDFHVKAFEALAGRLAGFTETCVVSFFDFYRSVRGNAARLGLTEPPAALKEDLLGRLAETARQAGLALETCAEDMDFERLGVRRGACVDRERLERLGGCRLEAGRDKNQRPQCGCCESVDIGAYSTCPGGCLYCYASHSPKRVVRNIALHDPASPLLVGHVEEGDVVREREAKSWRV